MPSSYSLLIIDRDSPDLSLSECQHNIFAGWKRPQDLLRERNAVEKTSYEIEPVMAVAKPTDLVQDVLTDCSVVASLCATTSRSERGLGTVCVSTRRLRSQ